MNSNYDALYEKLSHLQWLLQRYHIYNRSERGPFADPTRGQGRVLAMLKMQPEISTKDLSYLLGIRQQSLNELLNKLEKAGYVVREPSETDRRVMLVKLTEKGKEEHSLNTDYSDIFDCLSSEEQKTLDDYLDRIIAALEKQLGIEDSDDMESWMKSARSRMGDDMFERMISMRSRFGGAAGKGGFGPDRPGFGPEKPDFGPDRPGFRPERPGFRPEKPGFRPEKPGFGPEKPGFRPDRRGPAPEDLPGAERFEPDYDGPVPGRGEEFPLD